MLLSAEQAVQRVLESAASLQERAGRYEEAQRHIADTKASLTELAGELKACAASLKSAGEGMAAAGTPEIMSKVNAQMERVSALEEASAKIANRVDSQLAKSMQQLDEGLSGKIRSELSATQQALAKELTGAIRPLSDEISAANGRIDSLETSARQAAGRQKLILGLLVVGILGIVAAVAVPLLGLGQNAG